MEGQREVCHVHNTGIIISYEIKEILWVNDVT